MAVAFGYVGSLLSSIIPFVCFFINVYWLYHIWFCPRLYIIKEVASIIGTASGSK